MRLFGKKLCILVVYESRMGKKISNIIITQKMNVTRSLLDDIKMKRAIVVWTCSIDG